MIKTLENPFVSVVIPAFNEEKYIGETLQSLSGQKFDNFEVIVVDNNSSDNTVKIADNLGAVVLREEQQGVGYARQKGFSEARGGIIVSTDADTVFPENWISNIVSRFENDKDLIGLGGVYSLYSGSIMARFFFRHFFYFFLKVDKFFSKEWSFVGVNFSVRKDAFLKIGGFNTKLTLDEDVEFAHRLGKIGKVLLDPKICVGTSGRRYRNGLIVGLMDYLPHIITRILFKRYDRFIKLMPVRVENPSINRALIMVSLAVFFLFFAFLNPEIVRAKNIDLFRKKVDSVVNEKITLAKDVIENNKEVFRGFIDGR